VKFRWGAEELDYHWSLLPRTGYGYQDSSRGLSFMSTLPLIVRRLGLPLAHLENHEQGPEPTFVTPGAISVVSVTQQIDLCGAVGRMVASEMFGLAEIEYRRERQAAGIRVARKEGVYTGRQKGTTKGKPERTRALKNQGLTVAEIANAMAVSNRTVFRYLSQK